MKPLSADEFLNLMSRVGIGINAQYAANWPRNLAFQSESVASISWSSDNDAGFLVRFLSDMLDVLCANEAAYLWPKSPNWINELTGSHPVAGVWCHDLATLNSGEGAIEFDKIDRPVLVSALASSVVFGWSWPSDLYVVPATGVAVVHIGHSEDVLVAFATDASRSEFAAALEARNWRLDDDE